MPNREQTRLALEKSYALEAELDEERAARVKEFTLLISEILEMPDAKRRLDYISRLMEDTVLIDRAWEAIKARGAA